MQVGEISSGYGIVCLVLAVFFRLVSMLEMVMINFYKNLLVVLCIIGGVLYNLAMFFICVTKFPDVLFF